MLNVLLKLHGIEEMEGYKSQSFNTLQYVNTTVFN